MEMQITRSFHIFSSTWPEKMPLIPIIVCIIYSYDLKPECSTLKEHFVWYVFFFCLFKINKTLNETSRVVIPYFLPGVVVKLARMMTCYLIVAIVFSCALSPQSVKWKTNLSCTHLAIVIESYSVSLGSVSVFVRTCLIVLYESAGMMQTSSSPGIHTMSNSSSSLCIYTTSGRAVTLLLSQKNLWKWLTCRFSRHLFLWMIFNYTSSSQTPT